MADPEVEALLAGFGQLSAEQRRVVAAALLPVVTLPPTIYDKRDALIVECRRRFFPNHTDHDAAHELAVAWRRYAASAWQRDRTAETCPARIAGKLQGALWTIMQISPRVLSAERIRKIVGRLK